MNHKLLSGLALAALSLSLGVADAGAQERRWGRGDDATQRSGETRTGNRGDRTGTRGDRTETKQGTKPVTKPTPAPVVVKPTPKPTPAPVVVDKHQPRGGDVFGRHGDNDGPGFNHGERRHYGWWNQRNDDGPRYGHGERRRYGWWNRNRHDDDDHRPHRRRWFSIWF